MERRYNEPSMAHLESGSWEEERGSCLAPGQLLASRYRIVAFLGKGAVGEVYEAEDLELADRIAIKILRPEIARDERVLQRFKREIQLARRVTHPNVCRVFDLVYHPAEGPHERVFLTMELLRGETLEQRLAREGRITTAEALPVIGHIAAALGAAHVNGVVHRDLKSGNVFLVPTSSGTRAMVTDFGLAWSSIHQDSSAANLTATGELVGSPAYMAPEQVRGEEATPATDIYALGVVMFEMITGELPFVGKSAFYTALKRLQEPAPSPRVHLSDLDPAWETTVLRCLERDPDDRFPTVRHVVRSLGATKAEEDATSPLTLVRRRRSPWPARLGVAAVLAGALAGGLWLAGLWPFARERPAAGTVTTASSKPAVAVVALRPSVAVLPFDNLSGSREGSRGDVLFELLPLELAATGKLRVIPPGEVDRVAQDLDDSNSVPRLRQRLGADFLVSGAVLTGTRGEPARYDVLVRDARTGRTVTTVTTVAESGGAPLESLGRRLRAALGAGELSAGNADALRASLPNAKAAPLYAEALHRLRRFDAPAARDLLLKAVATDPGQPLVRSALAAAWRDLGYMKKAQEEAKKAVALATALGRADRLAVEGRYHETALEWPEAVASYQELTAIFPDDLEAGLRLAAAQTEGGQGAQAAETVARLRLLPAPLGDDPRIDLAEGTAAGSRRDFERQKTAAEQALRQARARGDRILAAEARLLRGGALIELQDLDGAQRELEEARRAFSEAGRPRGMAEALRYLGVVYARQDRTETMRAAYGDLVAIYRKIGAEQEVAQGLKQAANLYLAAGDLPQAESFYRQAQAQAHKIGDQRTEASVLHNLAKVNVMRGRLAEAKKVFQSALAIHREIGFAVGEGATLQGLGTIASTEGDLLEARRNYREALAVYRRIGAEKNMAEVFNNLAEVSFLRGELAQCRREREQARDLALRSHQEYEAARAIGGIAAVLRQQGDLTGARGLFEESLAIYRRLDLPLKAAEIQDEIGATLVLQGELIEALKSFRQALAATRQGGNPKVVAEVLSHQGQALLRYGELQSALASEKESIEICRALEQPEAEAQVELGHIQLAQGDLAAARKSFEQALATFRQRGERSGVAAALAGLGETLLRQGEPGQARQRHEEALAIRTDLGEKLRAAESRLALTGVALASGAAAQAETAARREVDAFRKLANAPGEAAATLLLARTLLAQNKADAARQILQGAARLLDASQEPAVRTATAELRTRVGGPIG
jgi:tetratricopeptide (TPR) repeat protein/tRNA A-37 threonylcarbamoyl transferase component Bud32/TolB-like protein